MSLFACGQSNNRNAVPIQEKDTTQNTHFVLDTSVIVILPINVDHKWLFKDTTSINLTNKELQTADSLLNECVRVHNINQDSTKRFSEFIDLKKYKRQYVAFANPKGERKVFINCLCSSVHFGYWKKGIVQVLDGGSCFFHVTINLTKLNYERLFVNGSG